jgi:Terminase large subunit, T4likevirus-type, N-terminal
MSSVAEAGADIFRPIVYTPLPSQRRFHESKARFLGFSGPVNSGKSSALVHETIRLSVINAGLVGLMGAPTYAMLRDVSQRALFEALENNSLPFTFHKAENRIVMDDFGTEILCRSLDAPERLRGTNLSFFSIDELTYCAEGAWTRLIARLRDPRATELKGVAAWTPKGFDWVWKYFIGPEKKSGYEAIRAVPGENWHTAPGYIEQLASAYDPRLYKQEVEGEYLPVSGNRVYYAFDRTKNVKLLDYNPKLSTVWWSLDFNVGLMCSVIAQIEDLTTRIETLQGKTNRVLNILDELALPNSNIEEVCNEFKRRMEPHTRHGQLTVMLYGDASANSRTFAGPSTWKLLREQFQNDSRFALVPHIKLANPSVQGRVNAANAMLLNHKGERRLMIDARCKTLIADLEQVAWKEDANKNQIAELDKTNPLLSHISDACFYLVSEEFGLRQRGQAMPGSPPMM